MKKKLQIILVSGILMLPLTLRCETLDEATLRSGSVIGQHDIPPILIAGRTYNFHWMVQSYVPVKSYLQVITSNGEKSHVEATLDRTVQGRYSIGDRQSNNYYFSCRYTVPNNIGKTTIGFYNGQDDGDPLLKMYGLLPTGIVERPSGTEGKQFFVNVCGQGNVGGQCVAYVRNYFGGSRETMPGLCNHNDCGAYHAYDDWNLGFGKGKFPKKNSIMVINRGNGLPVGHVAVVVSVQDNNDGTYNLLVQESNWDLDEKIDCAVSYSFDADTLTVRREGGQRSYNIRGFIYSNAE